MSDPTLPGGADTTLPGGAGPTMPGTAAGSWPAPAAPPTAGDPTGLYPATPPTAPPSAPPPLPPVPAAAGRPRAPRPGGARTVIGVILLFVAGLSAATAVAAGWTRTQIRDEDTWAATSEALVKDPEVQQDVADALARQVMTASGAQDAIEGVLPGPLGALAQPITGKATELVSDLALQLVRTDAFVKAWDVAVRNSHEELLAALDHEGRFTTVTADGVELDLGSTLEQFRLLLDDRGLTFLDGIDLSGLDVQFLLLDAPGIQRISDLLDVLDTLMVVLPIVAVVAGVGGLLIARRRSWALAAGGLGALVGVGVVWLGVQAGRSEAVDQIAGGILGPAAAESVVDHVTSSLATTMAVVAVVGVVLLVVGAGAAAVSSRRA